MKTFTASVRSCYLDAEQKEGIEGEQEQQAPGGHLRYSKLLPSGCGFRWFQDKGQGNQDTCLACAASGQNGYLDAEQVEERQGDEEQQAPEVVPGGHGGGMGGQIADAGQQEHQNCAQGAIQGALHCACMLLRPTCNQAHRPECNCGTPYQAERQPVVCVSCWEFCNRA